MNFNDRVKYWGCDQTEGTIVGKQQGINSLMYEIFWDDGIINWHYDHELILVA